MYCVGAFSGVAAVCVVCVGIGVAVDVGVVVIACYVVVVDIVVFYFGCWCGLCVVVFPVDVVAYVAFVAYAGVYCVVVVGVVVGAGRVGIRGEECCRDVAVGVVVCLC